LATDHCSARRKTKSVERKHELAGRDGHPVGVDQPELHDAGVVRTEVGRHQKSEPGSVSNTWGVNVIKLFLSFEINKNLESVNAINTDFEEEFVEFNICSSKRFKKKLKRLECFSLANFSSRV
jgi:hypothetical protein